MKKYLRVLLMALCCFSGAAADRIVSHYRHPLKHTQECQMVLQRSEHSFWFMRPNRELFEAYFDNPPILQVGMQFKDITYTDDNADLRHFVKATLK